MSSKNGSERGSFPPKDEKSEEKRVSLGNDVKKEDSIDIEEFLKIADARIDHLFRSGEELGFVESGEDLAIEGREGIEESRHYTPEETPSIDLTPLYGEKAVTSVAKEEKVTLFDLLEQANVTYLSLDWDFSLENLNKMQECIANIKSHITPTPKVLVIFGILENLLDWFKNHENTVSVVSLTLFKEALQLLTKVLQRDQKIGDTEEVLIAQLSKRFSILQRQYNLQAKIFVPYKTMPEKPREEREVQVVKREVETPAIEEVSPISVSLESFDELKVSIKNLVANIKNENVKFGKVIDTIEKRPKLKPLADGLKIVLSKYQRYSKDLEIIEKEIERVWSKELQVHTSRLEERLREEFLKPVPPPPPPPAEEIIPSTLEDVAGKIGDVYVFLCHGRYFALPSDYVVRIEDVSSHKASKIITKGQATIKDLNPFWRGVKYKVLGNWKSLKEGELKALTFKYLDVKRIFNLPGPKSGQYGGVAILASDREHSIVLFADSMVSNSPLKISGFNNRPDSKYVLGDVDIGRKVNVELLNIRTLAG